MIMAMAKWKCLGGIRIPADYRSGLSILYEAAGKFFHPQIPESLDWAIVIMLASSLINAVVSARLYYVGEKTGSEA